MKPFILTPILYFLFSHSLSHAAVPELITYQGTLRKAGAIHTGAVPMEFRITSQDGSIIYWTSGSTNVYVSGGLFRYALGAPNEAQFRAIPWTAITPHVQTIVDGFALPREPLYSSVYALHAKSAESIRGDFTLYDTDVRISTTAGSRGIIFQDGSIQSKAAGGATQWELNAGHMYNLNLGNIGIGTSSPGQKLHVIGNILAGGVSASTLAATGQDAAGFSLALSSGINTPAGTVNAGLFTGGGAGLVNLNAGNLTAGIVPLARLSGITNTELAGGSYPGVTGVGALGGLAVNGLAAFGTLPARSTFTAAGALAMASGQGIALGGGGELTGLPATPSGGSAATSKAYVDGLTGGGSLAAVLSATQTFTGQNTFANQMTVSSNLVITAGNLGIGTNSPASLLHLASPSSIDLRMFSTAADGYSRVLFATGGYGFRWNIGMRGDPGNAGGFVFESDSTGTGTWGNRLFLGVAGNIGVGTNAPDQRLGVAGNISQTGVFISSGAGNNYFAGNVGVNTVAPAARLHVAGTAKIDSTLDMSGQRILNAANPAAAQDAATKAYVDGLTGGGSPAAVLSATQTFTGQNTFSAQTTVSSHVFITAGNVGVGTSSPGARLHVSGGNIRMDSGFTMDWAGRTVAQGDAGGIGSLVLGGATGTTGEVYLRTAGQDRVTISNAGNVGIGMTNPAARLDIHGGDPAARILGGRNTNAGGGTLGINLFSGALGNAVAGDLLFANDTGHILISPNAAGKDLKFIGGGWTSPVSMIVRDGGNVGVGTAAPTRRLHVHTANGLNTLLQNDGIGNAVLEIQSMQNAQRAINFLDQAGAAVSQLGVWGGTNGVSSMTFTTSGQVRVKIDETGSVGVGTANPGRLLDVSGAAHIRGIAYFGTGVPGGAGHNGIVFQSNSGHWDANEDLSGNLQFKTWSGRIIGVNGASFLQNGNVGVGTTGPQGRFHVLSNSTTDPYVFATSHTATGFGVVVSTTGNVGIGTPSPLSKTHIRGSGSAGTVDEFIRIENAAAGGGTYDLGVTATGSSTGGAGDSFFIAKTGSGLRLFISTGGNVGIGTVAPNAKLTVGAAVNTNLAPIAMFDSTGNKPLFVGQTSNNLGIMIGHDGNDIQGRSGTSFATNGDLTLNRYGGNVGIGTTAPMSKLHVAGGGALRIYDASNTRYADLYHSNLGNLHLDTVGGGTAYVNWFGGTGLHVGNGAAGYGAVSASAFNVSSSRAVKADIADSRYGLGEILRMKAVRFRYRNDPRGIAHVGLIAEEVAGIVPEAVSRMTLPGGADTIGVDYGKLVAVLIEAIKEQQAQIEALRSSLSR